MADAVARDWRRKKPGTHTSEIRKEVLSESVQELLLEMADLINGLTLKQVETEKLLAELQTDFAAVGSVTLNDLVRRTG
jgi:hypothetical protein